MAEYIIRNMTKVMRNRIKQRATSEHKTMREWILQCISDTLGPAEVKPNKLAGGAP